MSEHALNQDQSDKISKKYKGTDGFNEPKSAAEKEYALDWIIDQLTGVKNSKWGTPVNLDAKAIKFIIEEAALVFAADNMLVEITAPVKVMGDTHGQFFDLFRLFEISGWPSKDRQILFIGDYIDRGK